MKIKPDLYLKGVFMGIAEIIPGVSGGTIAFITGIYEELIDSIKSINTKTLKLLLTFKFSAFWKEINGTFLITLVFGMLTSILILSRFIVYLLDDHPFKIWGFFFGLIIASGILIFYQIKRVNSAVFLSFLIGLMISSFIALQAPSNTPNTNFYIFSDGITDQVGGSKNLMYGKKRLLKHISQSTDIKTVIQSITDDFNDYQKDNNRRDDLSLFGFSIS